jgi:hypothetical protein
MAAMKAETAMNKRRRDGLMSFLGNGSFNEATV